LWALALVSLAGNVLTFGGDPEIHLVFAQNLLRGHALQFNPGIYSSGETSPLYMLLLSGVLYLVGLPTTAIFMKLLGVGSAIGLLVCVREEAERALTDPRAAMLLASAIAAAPFFFFQAQLGMENMPFAWIAALLVRRLQRPMSLAGSVVVSGLAHASFFIRPEAVFIIAAVYGSILLERRHRPRVLAASCCFSLLLAGVVWSLQQATGVSLQGAGEMRVLAARLESFAIPGTPFRLNRSPWIFVAYAWPLLAAISVRRRQLERADYVVLGCFIAAPLLAHLFNVFPNTHFTRYTLYCWFPLLLVAGRAMRGDRSLTRVFVALFVLNTLCIGCVELGARIYGNRFANTRLSSTLTTGTPAEVERISDRLCAQIDCSKSPVRVALFEVQLRLRLDERFEVRSLDGVVDIGLQRFVAPSGELDLVRYLEAEHVDLILDFPAARAPNMLSLRKIYQNAATQPVRVGCSIYQRRDLSEWLYAQALVRKPVADCP
jgi:hypothetical protein